MRSVAGRVGPHGPKRAQDRSKSPNFSRQGQNRPQNGPGGLHGHSQPRHGLSKAPARSNPSPDAVKTAPPRQGHSKAPQGQQKNFAGQEGFFLTVGAPFCTCWPGLGGCEDTASAIRGREIKLANASVVGLGPAGMIQLCLRARMRCEPRPSGACALCSRHFRARVLFSA